MIRTIRRADGDRVDVTSWPATIPAIEQVLTEGLEFSPGLTVLVGENGSGKSTFVEMLAEACGLNRQGGSIGAQLFTTRESERALSTRFFVDRTPDARAKWSYFLRAETMHQFYTYLEDNPGTKPERFHLLSHGEGFLEILRTRVNQPGFYLMDEPDAPLSFTSCLGLAALLHDLAEAGSQLVVATHSPIVAAIPGATILELGDWGIRRAQWSDLHIVSEWRLFLNEPDVFFHHLLAELPAVVARCTCARSLPL
jgi:predicted ATPase